MGLTRDILDSRGEPSFGRRALSILDEAPHVEWEYLPSVVEEITLLFGAHQAWRADQKEVRVALSDRIVLNPYAAKRLALMLEKGLKEYEAKFGELKV